MSKTSEGQSVALAAGLAYGYTAAGGGSNLEGVVLPLTLTPDGALRVARGQARDFDFNEQYVLDNVIQFDTPWFLSPLWATGFSFGYDVPAPALAQLSYVAMISRLPPFQPLLKWSGADLLQPTSTVYIRPGIDNGAPSVLIPSLRYSLPVPSAFILSWRFNVPVTTVIDCTGAFLA